jgi:hypothetical protein
VLLGEAQASRDRKENHPQTAADDGALVRAIFPNHLEQGIEREV